MKPALIALSIILLVSLATNRYLYFSEDNGVQKQDTELRSQNAELNNQNTELTNQIANLQNQNSILQNENSSLQTKISNAESQVENLTVQFDILQQQLNSSQSVISTLQSQNMYLQNQLNSINNPNLVTSIGIKDIHLPPMLNPYSTNYRLFIEGTVYNTGRNAAFHCDLKVTAYRGTEIVISTHIELGTINGGSSVSVSSNLPYQGDALTHWEIIPECTNTP